MKKKVQTGKKAFPSGILSIARFSSRKADSKREK